MQRKHKETNSRCTFLLHINPVSKLNASEMSLELQNRRQKVGMMFDECLESNTLTADLADFHILT